MALFMACNLWIGPGGFSFLVAIFLDLFPGTYLKLLFLWCLVIENNLP
jgi:hypothetical protein